MKSKRETWINRLEDMILQLASQKKEYAHIHSVMMAETDKLLNNEPSPKSNNERADSLNEPKMIYREITSSFQHLFSDVNIGDTLRVLSNGEITTENLRGKIGAAVIRFNEETGLNHIYESHKDELGIKFKRVG